jgi:hypothetical protein
MKTSSATCGGCSRLSPIPPEGLDVELKGWLDLADGEQAASLLIAVERRLHLLVIDR